MRDEDLIREIRSGNREAVEALFDRYKALIRKMAKARFLIGGETEDLIQEGMIGLYKAIRDYDPDNERRASFSTFACLCIDRQMSQAIEASLRQKNRALNDSVPLTDSEWADMADTEEHSPEVLILENEVKDETLRRIREHLSRMENEVLDLYMDGYDYKEIARQMGKTPKSIDNAIQRIRKKAQGEAG